jgi:hypothetical protein
MAANGRRRQKGPALAAQGLVLLAVLLGACSNSPQALPAVHLWPGDAAPQGALFWVSADIPNGSPDTIALTGMAADLCIVQATDEASPSACGASQTLPTTGTQAEALVLAEYSGGSFATVVAVLDESVATLRLGPTVDAGTSDALSNVDSGADR